MNKKIITSIIVVFCVACLSMTSLTFASVGDSFSQQTHQKLQMTQNENESQFRTLARTPQTYEFVYGLNLLCFPGDTITFTRELLPETLNANTTYDLASGFRITDQHSNNDDVTGEFVDILESAPTECGGGLYTKVRITGDKPVYIASSGGSPVKSETRENKITIVYRAYTIDATICENSYQILWNTDGGVFYTDTNPKNYYISAQDSIITPMEDPVKEGYHFSGWSRSNYSNRAVSFSFYPQQASYIGGTQKMTVGKASPLYNSGVVVYNSEKGGYVLTPEAGIITFKANYVTETQYYHCGTVTFDAKGGSVMGRSTMMTEVRVNEEGEILIPSMKQYAPTKEGFQFGGWFADEGYTIPVTGDYDSAFTVASISSENPQDRSRTIYAKWTPLVSPPTDTFLIFNALSANGKITFDKEEATAGERVQITATPDAGYRLKEIKILDGLGQNLVQEIGLVIENNSFSMPNMNVRIQGIFEKIDGNGKTNEYVATQGNIEGKVNFKNEVTTECILDIRSATVPSSLKKEGITSIFVDVMMIQENLVFAITENQMVVTMALPKELYEKGNYKVYFINNEGQAVEQEDAFVEGSLLQFSTQQLGRFLVEASEAATPPVQNGWYKEQQGECYFKNGVKVTNQWIEENNKWFYINEAGYKAFGWVKYRGYWYFMENVTGVMKIGWVKDKGQWYYLDGSGKMLKGWVKHKNAWYYLDSSGKMVTGWLKYNNGWYYLQGSGEMVTGWLNRNNKWYYLNNSGKMATGWLKNKNTWYYLHNSGEMAIGWVKSNGAWYYLQNSGVMKTGWLKYKNNWYYLLDSGKMATGWITVNRARYYLDSTTGIWKG